MKTVKRATSILLILCILASFMSLNASAAITGLKQTEINRYNVMLVIDGSGSLLKTDPKPIAGKDPKPMRYELIGDVLGFFTEGGNNIGAIVFSGNRGSGTSQSAMESGFLLKTELYSQNTGSPDGRPVTEFIKAKIESAGIDDNLNGVTDIGTALLTAERMLQEKQKENGLPSVVFLFSDGLTEFYDAGKDVFPVAEANRETATKEMMENNIRLFGAYLHATDARGGKYRSEATIKSIVCAANGIGEYSSEFAYSYVDLKNAKDAHIAADAVLKFLHMSGEDPVAITEDFEDSFVIPGVGVESLTVRLHSDQGEDMPDVDVSFISPDGKKLPGSTLVSASGRTYRQYRLRTPDSGIWTVKITLPKGKLVKLYYTPFLNLSIDADVGVTPEIDKLYVNQDANLTAYLVNDDGRIMTADAYSGYDCTIEVKDESTGVITPYSIQMDGNNSLTLNMPLTEYATYSIRSSFSCDKFINIVSDWMTFSLTNNPPEKKSSVPVQNLTCGLFQESKHDVELKGYVFDIEDGENLNYRLVSDPSGTSVLDGTKLTLKNAKVGDCTITVEVSDSRGAATELPVVVHVKNMTVPIIIGIVVALLIILIIVLLVIYYNNSHVPKGKLMADMNYVDGSKNIKNINLELDVPGSATKHKTNLYSLLANALDSKMSIGQGNDVDGAKAAVARAEKELKRVIISAKTKKVSQMTSSGKSKKVRAGAVKVKDRSSTTVLYNSCKDVEVMGIRITLNFIPEGEEPVISGYDNNFSTIGQFDGGMNGGFNGNFAYGGNNGNPFGGAGNGAPFGGSGNGAPFGGSGNGAPFGGAGNGAPFGGAGNGAPFGGAGNGAPFGGSGNGAPFGGSGNGAPFGGSDNDTSFGGSSNGAPFGGAGSDPFGGSSSDPFGGAGNDPFGGSNNNLF